MGRRSQLNEGLSPSGTTERRSTILREVKQWFGTDTWTSHRLKLYREEYKNNNNHHHDNHFQQQPPWKTSFSWGPAWHKCSQCNFTQSTNHRAGSTKKNLLKMTRVDKSWGRVMRRRRKRRRRVSRSGERGWRVANITLARWTRWRDELAGDEDCAQRTAALWRHGSASLGGWGWGGRSSIAPCWRTPSPPPGDSRGSSPAAPAPTGSPTWSWGRREERTVLERWDGAGMSCLGWETCN